MSQGARSLIQLTVEEILSWVIKSTRIAVGEVTSRKAIGAHDLHTMFRILKQHSKILQGELPEYTGLDELGAEIDQRASSSRGGRAVRRGRGRGARGRSRSPPRAHDAGHASDSSS